MVLRSADLYMYLCIPHILRAAGIRGRNRKGRKGYSMTSSWTEDKEEDWHKFSQHIEGRKRLRRRRALAGRWAAVVMCVACSRERGEEEVEESQGEKRLRRDRQRQRNSESGESYVHSFTM